MCKKNSNLKILFFFQKHFALKKNHPPLAPSISLGECIHISKQPLISAAAAAAAETSSKNEKFFVMKKLEIMSQRYSSSHAA